MSKQYVKEFSFQAQYSKDYTSNGNYVKITLTMEGKETQEARNNGRKQMKIL